MAGMRQAASGMLGRPHGPAPTGTFGPPPHSGSGMVGGAALSTLVRDYDVLLHGARHSEAAERHAEAQAQAQAQSGGRSTSRTAGWGQQADPWPEAWFARPYGGGGWQGEGGQAAGNADGLVDPRMLLAGGRPREQGWFV